jgi:hypothetical protein
MNDINRVQCSVNTCSKRPLSKEYDSSSLKKSKRSSELPFEPVDFNSSRARLLTSASSNADLNANGKIVVYWMSRDHRAEDNHALYYAQVTTSRRSFDCI